MSAPTLDLSVRTVTLPPTTTGPVRFDWLQAVAQIAGRSKALYVAVLLAWLAARRGRPDVTVTRRHMALWSLSRDACGDALRLLRAHGLALVWSRRTRTRPRRRSDRARQRHALDPLLTKRTPNGIAAVLGCH